jgi:hypothetical protein
MFQVSGARTRDAIASTNEHARGACARRAALR